MKRLLVLLLALLMLAGCAETAPEPQEGPLPANIRIGELDAPRSFSAFRAAVPGPGAGEVRAMAQEALAEYPRSLLAQLGDVEILLVGRLTGEGAFSGGAYAGFTQRTEEGWRMVLDVDACHAGTVHHELAHVLDGILTAAGGLEEREWEGLNPSGFTYGADGWEGFEDFFAESYAMENIREDRAAVFEAAVMGGEGVFEGKSSLWLKLYTFSEALRAHFDTDGWPDACIWELALR